MKKIFSPDKMKASQDTRGKEKKGSIFGKVASGFGKAAKAMGGK